MTLNEVADQVGLSRRMIQEYEKAGLVKKPERKNKYGHLIYDEKTVDRLWQIRFYREVGYNSSQIRAAISESACNDEAQLERLLKSLAEEKERLENMISLVTIIKEWGICFGALRHEFTEALGIKSDNVFAILGLFCKYMDMRDYEDRVIDVLSEDEWDTLFVRFRKIAMGYQRKVPYDDRRVQKMVAEVHEICKKAISDSNLFFKEGGIYLYPENKLGREVFEDKPDAAAEYVYQAFQYYCSKLDYSRNDVEYIEALDNLERLAYARYSAGSEEIQREVRQIHNFYRGIKFFTEDAQLEMVEKLGKMFGSQAYRNMFDCGRKKGVAWFTSRAIEIYCNNYRQESRVQELPRRRENEP